MDREQLERLLHEYHHDEPELSARLDAMSPEQFLRLFLTAHGMKPAGAWQTHTYARVTDSESGREHFFLIPMPAARGRSPAIRFEGGRLWVDDIETAVRPQSIPYTTPFWYFHYDPNREQQPFSSMTLNLKPACPEKCVLCAGARTGRVNNGMEGALEADAMLERVFRQHPEAEAQLDSVAVVTGCFDGFDALAGHLRDVRNAARRRASPQEFRVLEHNVETEQQFDIVVGELGYDVFVTLECFDQENRRIALNGRVGRKGRDAREFVDMMEAYADYLEARPQLGRRLVHVTYLAGIDSLDTMQALFSEMEAINRRHRHAIIAPWLSIYTAYEPAMRAIQRPDFSLRFLLEAQDLARAHFPQELLTGSSGSTADGYARGLF